VKLVAVVAAVAALVGVASADTAPAASPTAADPSTEFDENADATAREANLESKAPREGVMFGAALGGGIMLGGGVGRGPVVDFRLGHKATQRTQITFELVISSSLHKEAEMSTLGQTLTDSVTCLCVGAQRYTAVRSPVWVRAAGGPTFFQADFGKADAPKPRSGVGGLLGAGFDVFRWGKVVFGLEATTVASVSSAGFKLDLNFCSSLMFY
jgi:hypothetical protein